MEDGKLYYGNKGFSSRDELRAYIQGLPPAEVGPDSYPRPVLLRGKIPRLVLMAENGRQLSHHYLCGVLVNNVEYL